MAATRMRPISGGSAERPRPSNPKSPRARRPIAGDPHPHATLDRSGAPTTPLHDARPIVRATTFALAAAFSLFAATLPSPRGALADPRFGDSTWVAPVAP